MTSLTEAAARMWPTLKRLLLGVSLITMASAVLLLSDTSGRRTEEGRLPRVALLQQASQHIIEEGVDGMIAGLAEAGFVDGTTIALRRFNAEGDTATSNTIAKEITAGGYDLVLTATTLSMQAVANANRTTHTKHVFALVSDPFGAGVGISRENPLEHPPYMAGFGTLQPVAESFRIARKLRPELKTVGAAWNPAESNSEINMRMARDACRELGIELVETHVENSAGVAEAIAALVARGVEAIWIGGDVTVLTSIDSVVRVARDAHVPVLTVIPGNAKRGTLFDIGADYHEVGRLAGVLAGKVLHGADPATIPIENVMPESLMVNRTALAGLHEGWSLPEDVVAKATTVIDETGVHEKKTARAAPAGRTFKIGIAYFAPDPGAESCLRGLFDGLRANGIVEGENLEVTRVHAQGEIANIPAMLQSLDGQGLDLIVPMTTPCLTGACAVVKHTPVVFTYVYDPVAAGAGTSFTDHLPNVTGIGSFPPVDDTVAMIGKLVPKARVVGTIYNASEANSRKVVEVARAAFTAAGIRLEEAAITNSSEVFQAAQALVARGVGAFWITGDNTALIAFEGIVKAATAAGLPIVNNDPEFLEKGALATVGIGFYESGVAAAKLAARVLRGESPKDLPIENVAKKTMLVNSTVAHRLGIAVPSEVLAAADAVIDESGRHDRAPAQPAAPAPTAAPLAKTWNLDLLEYVNVLDVEDAQRGIETGLRESGLVEGRDYRLRVRNAQGDMPTLAALVDAALSDGSDLILTLSTPTLQAALRRAGRTPVVFTFLADAIAAGAGKSNDDHLPNTTGVITAAAVDELMDIVRQTLPKARRLGSLFVPAEVNSVYNKDRLADAAKRHGFELVVVPVDTSAEVSDAALSLLAQGIDAICQVPGNITTAAFASIARPASRARMPVFGFLSGEFKNGSTVVVARDYYEGGREAAGMAARIMRGENPARIPFQLLTTTRVLVNEAAARDLGVKIPASVLARAERPTAAAAAH